MEGILSILLTYHYVFRTQVSGGSRDIYSLHLCTCVHAYYRYEIRYSTYVLEVNLIFPQAARRQAAATQGPRCTN